jgi:hypothetical protein
MDVNSSNLLSWILTPTATLTKVQITNHSYHSKIDRKLRLAVELQKKWQASVKRLYSERRRFRPTRPIEHSRHLELHQTQLHLSVSRNIKHLSLARPWERRAILSNNPSPLRRLLP